MVRKRHGFAACLIGLVLMCAGLGIGPAGWVAGGGCGVILAHAADRQARADGVRSLGPADLITLTRATLACGVAALVAEAYIGADVIAVLVAVTVLALALDFVDGQVARRTGTPTAYGGRLDGESDAFLILVLSISVARDFGCGVLLLGVVRYAYAAAARLLPWMQRPLPQRYWRKVVAAYVGIALTCAVSGVGPSALSSAALIVALVLLAESFGWDVVWLWRRRPARVNRTGLTDVRT